MGLRPRVTFHLVRLILMYFMEYEPVRNALQQLHFIDQSGSWDTLWLLY